MIKKILLGQRANGKTYRSLLYLYKHTKNKELKKELLSILTYTEVEIDG